MMVQPPTCVMCTNVYHVNTSCLLYTISFLINNVCAEVVERAYVYWLFGLIHLVFLSHYVGLCCNVNLFIFSDHQEMQGHVLVKVYAN